MKTPDMVRGATDRTFQQMGNPACKGHLMRAFKASTGLTIHAYVEQVRLAKAKALLSDTDIQLKEIAFRLGFSNAANFSAAFRKSAGESPREFRRRVGRLN